MIDRLYNVLWFRRFVLGPWLFPAVLLAAWLVARVACRIMWGTWTWEW